MGSVPSPPRPEGALRSTYRELEPPPWLCGRLLCTWVQTIGEREHLHRVLPDGCVDLVWIGDRPPEVAGPATRWLDKPLAARTSIVGVRLRPGWVPEGLGLPASELVDQEVELGDVWRGADGDPRLRPADRVPPGARLAGILEALGARWAEAGEGDRLVSFSVEWLMRHPAGRIRALAGELGLSGRHLQRRFAAAVGYGPKTFQRIARFQHLLALGCRRARVPTLGAIALRAGYADQAHMNREVSELAGGTPGALLGWTDTTLHPFEPEPEFPAVSPG